MDEEIDMELEDERIEVYNVVEIDFDYEFDAARFFDFTRPESKAESHFSESWFHTAPDYPPSPFIAQLFPLNGLSSPHVNASPKYKYDDRLTMDGGNADIDRQKEYCNQDDTYKESPHQSGIRKLYDCSFPEYQSQAEYLHRELRHQLFLVSGPSRGLTFYNHLVNDIKKTKTNSHAKPHMKRSSTLMKPTASQLAKLNQLRKDCGFRSQKNEGTNVHSGIESQAPKRQKLDGGQLRRIVDMKQTVNLTHKLPKKDAAVQGLNSNTRLRITIPREPVLATAHRAERIRSTSTKEMENSTAVRCRFKARPFSRKISEAPTNPFPRRTTKHMSEYKASHLETTGRIKQQNSTAATSVCQTDKGLNKINADSSVETGSRDGKVNHCVDAPKAAVQVVHSFKAWPLDRKILTSRGDIGIFRNSKRDVTVPKEFEFQTSKRTQHNLPTELFSKLSLAGEPQLKNGPQVELPVLQKTTVLAKGSKENRWDSCHQNYQNMTHQAKEKRENHIGKERLIIANGVGNGETSQNYLSRPFGSRRQQ